MCAINWLAGIAGGCWLSPVIRWLVRAWTNWIDSRRRASRMALYALIAFDADYKTNPVVARQLARLIAAREQDIASHQLLTSTKIVTWQRYKGIDDAVLANIPLEIMTNLEWISTLQGKPLQEVRAVWEQMRFTPTSSPVKNSSKH